MKIHLEKSKHANRPLVYVFVLTLLLCIPLAAGAQKYSGTLRGIVTDKSGAVVPNAAITVTNTNTGEIRTVATNQQGEYVVLELAAGVYEVRIKQPNFKEFVSKGVELHVASTAVVDATLQVGSAGEQVTVQADLVQVETSTGTVGNVIEGNEVRELPLNGRSFAQLTQLMPGVSPAANFDSKHKGLEAGVDFSVNGNSTTGNIFTVDGVNNNDIGSNRTILVYPSIDAIQEFKILRNSYGAEYGQAMGAVINIVTRGGTNQFHGGAYYFGRETNCAVTITDTMSAVQSKRTSCSSTGARSGTTSFAARPAPPLCPQPQSRRVISPIGERIWMATGTSAIPLRRIRQPGRYSRESRRFPRWDN